MSEDNVEVVRAYVEAYNAGGDAFVDFVVDFVAEDVEIVPDASRFTEAKPFRGREEYRRYIADIDQDWEGGDKSEIKEIFPRGRRPGGLSDRLGRQGPGQRHRPSLQPQFHHHRPRWANHQVRVLLRPRPGSRSRGAA